MIGDDLLSGFCVVSISARNWQFRATIWHASARPRAREDLDSINDRDLGMSLWEGGHMTDITWISLTLLMAILTMMVAAEVGQRRRSRQ